MTTTTARHRRPMPHRTVGWVLLLIAVSAALASPFLVMPHAAGAYTNPCDLIVHRGVHGPNVDEETARSVRLSARFGFGAEVDARVALDGLVAVHDDRLTRITAGADTRAPEDLTMEQLRAVELEHGGQLASIRHLVKAAKVTGARLLIEGKRYPDHTDAWRDYGIPALAAAVTDLGMIDRVFVGGTLGFTRAVHDLAPDLRTFWRADASDELTPAAAGDYHAGLVEADAKRWTSASASDMQLASILPATRNADTDADWRAAWRAGVTVMQTNRPQAAADWCAAR